MILFHQYVWYPSESKCSLLSSTHSRRISCLFPSRRIPTLITKIAYRWSWGRDGSELTILCRATFRTPCSVQLSAYLLYIRPSFAFHCMLIYWPMICRAVLDLFQMQILRANSSRDMSVLVVYSTDPVSYPGSNPDYTLFLFDISYQIRGFSYCIIDHVPKCYQFPGRESHTSVGVEWSFIARWVGVAGLTHSYFNI